VNRLRKAITLALIALITVLQFLTLFPTKVKSQTQYYLKPDFDENTKIPVNIETKLTAHIYDSEGNPPSVAIPLYIQLEWSTNIISTSSEGGTGLVEFTVKPPSSFNREPKAITFTSDYFDTVTVHVVCVPAIVIDVTYDKVQYIDPIENKDIVFNLTTKSSEDDSVIYNPLIHVEIDCGSTLVTYTYKILQEYGVTSVTVDLSPDDSAAGKIYDISLSAEYKDYYPLTKTISVQVGKPILVATFKFQTGEIITLKPSDSGKGLGVKKGCEYVDVYYKDYRGHDIDVFVDEITIVSSTLRTTNVVYEKIAPNAVRIYYTLVESWYIITPKVHAYLSNFYTVCNTEVKVSTTKVGFDITNFIMSPLIILPLLVILFLLFVRVIKKRKG